MKPNTIIDNYRTVFTLNKGTYFEVLRVVDAQGNKHLMRLINLAKLDDLQFEKDAQSVSEIKIMNDVSHVNILNKTDDGEAIVDGQRYAYMVSDFCSGETLQEKLTRENSCSVYETKRIIVGVLNALKYLHTRQTPIIHNGISPTSIMLDMTTNEPIAKIMDFAHARKLDKANRKFYMDGLSLAYLAPEMFKGLYSTRTDLYAVGTLMYQMIFGILPWQIDLSKTPFHEREKVVLEARKHPLPIPNFKIFELDEQMLNIMAKALTQDVDERFQNADEFLYAITGVTTVECKNYKKFDIVSHKQDANKPLTKPKGNGFADVAGMVELKKRLQEEVIDLIRNPEKYKKLRVKIPNGILLYGPPGCGKTFIAERFAEELDCNYMYVHCSDVASPYIHGGQEKIAALFQQARDNAPTVLFLDELDAMLADRSRHNNVSESGEVNEFLAQLNNSSDDGVFVIGATNKPTLIDPAALRSGRLDIKVYVPAPSKEEREALLRLSLKDIADSDIDFDKLASLTSGYVSKDICVLVNKAALASAKDDKESISMSVMLTAIEKSKDELPSVSETELLGYEKIRKQFSSKKNNYRPVGFTVNK